MNSNKTFSLSIGFLCCSIIIIALLHYMTRNAVAIMSLQDALCIFGTCSIFLLLPEAFGKKSLFVFLGLTLLLPLLGIFTIHVQNLNYVIVLFLASASVVLNLRKFRNITWNFIAFGFLTLLFFILLIYSSFSQILSPVFAELIINGKSVPDTLFHAAISNSILFENSVSTQIHGNSTFSYHWFSHYLYAGLSALIGIKSIEFYNWGYPIIILPLFIKHLYILFSETLSFFSITPSKILIFFPGLIIYVFVFLGVGGFSSYLSSESLMLSHIYQFIFWIMVIRYQQKLVDQPFFTIAAFALLVLILFTKVSVGVITFMLATYLYFRYSQRKLHYAILILLSIIFGLICYLYFLAIRNPENPVNFLTRIQNFTSQAISYISYIVSIFYIFYFFLNKENSFSAIINNFKNKKIILEEIILLSIVLSFGLGLFFGANKGDSLYFASTFFFLNFIILLLLIVQNFTAEINPKRSIIVVYFIIFTSFVMFPQPAMIKYNSFKEKNDSKIQNPLMRELVKDLIEEKYIPHTVISILPEEKWFYESQKYKITTPFIISGMSNLPALLSISKENLYSNQYSFDSYKKNYSGINNHHQLVSEAKKLGYKKIIQFYSFNGKLNKRIININ